MLVNRKQGERFEVKDGELVSLTSFQKFRYKVQKSYRHAVRQRLKPVVSGSSWPRYR